MGQTVSGTLSAPTAVTDNGSESNESELIERDETRREAEVEEHEADETQGNEPVQEWLRKFGFKQIDDVKTVRHEPARGNCHGLTFKDSADEWCDPETVEKMIADGRYETGIVICIKDGKIAHSAKPDGSRYLQTFPDGPTISTPWAFLKANYEICLKLPDDIAKFAPYGKGTVIEEELMQFRSALGACEKLTTPSYDRFHDELEEIEKSKDLGKLRDVQKQFEKQTGTSWKNGIDRAASAQKEDKSEE